MGSKNGEVDEAPLHSVFLDNYYIDVYGATNALYKSCVESGTCTSPDEVNSKTRDYYYDNPEFEKYPIIRITWDQAQQFCAWRNANLPTDAKWEKAARENSRI